MAKAMLTDITDANEEYVSFFGLHCVWTLDQTSLGKNEFQIWGLFNILFNNSYMALQNILNLKYCKQTKPNWKLQKVFSLYKIYSITISCSFQFEANNRIFYAFLSWTFAV